MCICVCIPKCIYVLHVCRGKIHTHTESAYVCIFLPPCAYVSMCMYCMYVYVSQNTVFADTHRYIQIHTIHTIHAHTCKMKIHSHTFTYGHMYVYDCIIDVYVSICLNMYV